MTAGSNPANFPISFEKLKELLACPACEGELRPAFQQISNSASQQVSRLPERLACGRCGRQYPIVDGIPVLIADRD